ANGSPGRIAQSSRTAGRTAEGVGFLASTSTSTPVDPERPPSLIAVLEAVDSGWRREAACGDEPYDRLFLSDKSLARNQPGSPTILLAVLVCEGCQVRRDCLLEAMT